MSPAPVLSAAIPQLFVADIKASCDFFTRSLGFSVIFVYGEPPFYAQVGRDEARLNLRHVDAPVIDPTTRDTESLLSGAINVNDATSLFSEFQTADVRFHQTLQQQPWGALDFIVSDPDGNLLLFAGPGAQSEGPLK